MVTHNVIDVLMFIFEHVFENESASKMKQQKIEKVLQHAGFEQTDIHRALIWLDTLVELCDQDDDGVLVHTQGVRVSSPLEQEHLSVECQSYLIQLEQLGILDDYSRELVIDRALALTDGKLSLESLDWVVQMVLYNLPGRENAYACMESLEVSTYLH